MKLRWLLALAILGFSIVGAPTLAQDKHPTLTAMHHYAHRKVAHAHNAEHRAGHRFRSWRNRKGHNFRAWLKKH